MVDVGSERGAWAVMGDLCVAQCACPRPSVCPLMGLINGGDSEQWQMTAQMMSK